MFGISQEELEEAIRQALAAQATVYGERFKDLETRLRRAEDRAGRVSSTTYQLGVGTTVTLEQIVSQVLEAARPHIDERIDQAVADLDLTGLADQMDLDVLYEKVAPALADRLKGDINIADLTSEVAASMLEDEYIDTTTVEESVIGEITDRLQVDVSLSDDEQ